MAVGGRGSTFLKSAESGPGEMTTVSCHVVSFLHLLLHALSLNQQPATWQINVHKVVESWAEGFSNLSFDRFFSS